MALPTRSDVQTLDFSGYGQPSAYLEAKALSPSSGTLGYSLQAQPVFGLPSAVTPGYTITALRGVYAVTGYTTNITRTRLLTAQSGTYALAGQDASVNIDRLILAQNGVYSTSGQSVDITYGGSIAGAQLFVEIRSFTERRRF